MYSTTVTAPIKGADAATTRSSDAHAEPVKLLRRIGSATVEITVHFSNSSKETMADIVNRLIEREVNKNA